MPLSKFIGNIWRDRVKEKERRTTEEILETERQRYGVRRIQTDKFAQSQFDIYIELWQTLQGLRLAVDSLWGKATKGNIKILANELSKTKLKVNEWYIFFEKRHLLKLNELFVCLENFNAGKIRLVDIRSNEDMRFVFPKSIAHQIDENRAFKDEFEKVLEELRESFQIKLSDIETPEYA